MQRIGFLLNVKPDKFAECEAPNQAVWPAMPDALRPNGWHYYSLFMRDGGTLFGNFETPGTFEADQAAMAQEETYAKWKDFMAPFFEGVAACMPSR